MIKQGIKVVIIFLFASLGTLKAQQTEYGAELDTNFMMIGDQIELRMKVRSTSETKVHFPFLKDTLVSGIEIISGPVRDSVQERDGRVLYQERYLITSFDTAVYVIPPLLIKVEREGYSNTLRTDPMQLIVNTYVVDEEKGNYDIVMPLDAPWTLAEILPYIGWGLLGLALLAVVLFLFLRWRAKKPLFSVEKPLIPPYILAIKALDEIKQEKPWQQGRTKEYYTMLTDTLRNYMYGEIAIPAMESTSAEIMQALADCEEVDPEDRERLGELLESADLVKFAKATPLMNENVRNLEVAYDFVNSTNERVKASAREEQDKSSEEIVTNKNEVEERDVVEEKGAETADSLIS